MKLESKQEDAASAYCAGRKGGGFHGNRLSQPSSFGKRQLDSNPTSVIQQPMPIPKLNEEDLRESFARSSGPGGQHVNKVSTAVTLTHLPTGLSVSVSDSRSQSMNRGIARERLAAKIAEQRTARQEKAKARRRLAPRSRSEKRKLVEGKRRRSEIKKGRGRVSE
jgi:protein subunit release factor B